MLALPGGSASACGACASTRRVALADDTGAGEPAAGLLRGIIGAPSMSRVLLFSLTAALYPTLLAATTVMLVLPNPKRLLLGYLLGALMTSVTLGLVIVFALD